MAIRSEAIKIMATAISFEHVSKMYQLGVVGTGTISNDLKRWWAMTVRGKEDPFLKIGQTNDRATRGDSDFVFALKDIDFKVEQGDVVGIIGKNGAGKSTLLKLLSRITAPTSGVIRAKGRIASLLEVGTGFHQELTGRENIYLNGTIMGMKRHEIDAKLDEIVDFAGVERYLDTPVKRYSSGMTVRLGFAVAAFLEPEILVVDEVLAVGDAEFQKKAIGKMNDVATNGGRTVLFVSHNMNSVRQLCKSGVVLKNGMVEMTGSADECVDFYMETSISDLVKESVIDNKFRKDTNRTNQMEYLNIKMLNDPANMATEEPLRLQMKIKRNNPKIKETQFGIFINNTSDVRVASCYTDTVNLPEEGNTFEVDVIIPTHHLAKGLYKVDMNISSFNYQAFARDHDLVFGVLAFEVKHVDTAHTLAFTAWPHNLGSVCMTDTQVSLKSV